jgi:hypothetical protein
MATACSRPPTNVDVWLRDDTTDSGLEPFTGAVMWRSPDIVILDRSGQNQVPNPTYHPTNRYNNIIEVTVRNRGTQTARNTEVHLHWADPATYIPYPTAWNTHDIFTEAPNFVNQSNQIVIPVLPAGSSTTVQFAWKPPAPGSSLSSDNHFCLLVRLENEADPSDVGSGGWNVVRNSNNIGLRNVYVQPAVGPSGAGGEAESAEVRFDVTGTGDQDSLIIITETLQWHQLTLDLPIQALPWRELKLLETLDRQRGAFGTEGPDPLQDIRRSLEGNDVAMFTDIQGAIALELQGGIARVFIDSEINRLIVPQVRLLSGVRMPVAVRASLPVLEKDRGYIHITQLSGGQIVGGVSLELWPTAEYSESMRNGE